MNKLIVYVVQRPNMPDFYLPLGMPLQEAKEFTKDFFDKEPSKTLKAILYEPKISSTINLEEERYIK